MTVLTKQAVIDLMQSFEEAWNRGDISGMCSVYADNATYVSKSGLIRGKKEIERGYRARYSDRASMGHLKLEFLEHRYPSLPREPILMSTAILRWTVHMSNGEAQSGIAHETFERRDEGIFIVQDVTVGDW